MRQNSPSLVHDHPMVDAAVDGVAACLGRVFMDGSREKSRLDMLDKV
jgi:hypothetical protein